MPLETTPKQKIMDFLTFNCDRYWGAEEIAEKLKINHELVKKTLDELKQEGEVQNQ